MLSSLTIMSSMIQLQAFLREIPGMCTYSVAFQESQFSHLLKLVRFRGTGEQHTETHVVPHLSTVTAYFFCQCQLLFLNPPQL